MKRQQYYIGTVVAVDGEDLLPNAKEYHEILVDIPEVAKGIKAYPKRGEVDEPRVGDTVLLLNLDPVFNSYMIYEKIKENDFIGFRASGKMVDITPDYITMCVYDPDEEFKDADRPDPSDFCYIKMDKDKNIEISAQGEYKMTIKGDITIETTDSNISVKASGDCKIETDGNTEVKANGDVKVEASGNCNVKGSKVEINGSQVKITGGMLETNGTVAPSTGPYCGIPNCLFTGAPHGGSKVSGT